MLFPRRQRVPHSRAMVCEVLHFARQVPSCAHDRVIDVDRLRDARRAAEPRISWPAIFMKAYALNARRFPRLRQTWMSWPWPHLYQHPTHMGVLVLRRQFEHDDWLFWGRLDRLDERPLVDIQRQIDAYQTEPVSQIFRRQVRVARLPRILCRLSWWLTFHISGNKKCKRMGTFYLTTISGQGAEIQAPPNMHTAGFTYGPIDQQGRTRLTIAYDHRLMDGHHVADVLAGVESALNEELLSELQSLQAVPNAA